MWTIESVLKMALMLLSLSMGGFDKSADLKIELGKVKNDKQSNIAHTFSL